MQFLETVGKTNEGRKTMAQAVKNIQLNGQKQIEFQQMQDEEILSSINLDISDDEEVEGFDTDWNIVKSKIDWSDELTESKKED